MQYLLLIYQAEEIWEAKSAEEKAQEVSQHSVAHEQMNKDAASWTGQPLMPVATALTVRKRGSELTVSDGPFATTKEQLAGLYLVDCEAIEQAVTYAGLLPEARTGCIEVRPVADHSGLTP